MRKNFYLVLASVLFSFSLPFASHAQGWQQSGNNWHYIDLNSNYLRDTWYQENGHYYYFDKAGNMMTGWAQDEDDFWYYLNPDGAMQTGELTLGDTKYKFNEDGICLNPHANLNRFLKTGNYTLKIYTKHDNKLDQSYTAMYTCDGDKILYLNSYLYVDANGYDVKSTLEQLRADEAQKEQVPGLKVTFDSDGEYIIASVEIDVTAVDKAKLAQRSNLNIQSSIDFYGMQDEERTLINNGYSLDAIE